MEKSYTLRLYNENDKNAVFNKVVKKKFFSKYLNTTFIYRLLKNLHFLESSFYVLEDSQQEIIAAGVIRNKMSIVPFSKSHWLYGIRVVKNQRRKGIGTILIIKLIEKLKEKKVDKVYLKVEKNNETAINLYLKLGFYIIGKLGFNIYMCKNLNAMNINRTSRNLNLIFTVDYEIHGNGDGSPYKLMVEPTYRLMALLEKYGAKLTIMADVPELICFKRYYEEYKEDKFDFLKIEEQLKNAVKRGHDVQLHIHSSYFNAKFNGKSWEQHWPEYNMAALSYKRIDEMIRFSKQLLQEMLLPVNPDYKCEVFRAANWSMMPTPNIYKALINNGIRIDTSVYKGGRQKGNVDYDYTNAFSHIFSYKASETDINKQDAYGKLTEYPIYTEMRFSWSFITPVRLFRMIRAEFHRHLINAESTEPLKKDPNKLSVISSLIKSPWKLDFNQASGNQLIHALKRISNQTKNKSTQTDIILIGHSKTFIPYNEETLEKFLRWMHNREYISCGYFSKSDHSINE
jgi:ribosomal protein S18 acetylase RimI-like enzyme